SELGELWEWFDDPVSRRWALVGEGGKGKSALAYNFAFEVKLKAPLPFQTVLWLSAKRRRFLEGTTKQVGEPDFFDLESALSRLLTYYGWVEEISNPTESKRIRTLELLTEFPALIIVDDVDSIESENESVIEFFSLQVTQTKSKVLFTSRRVPFGMGGTKTRVAGFSNEDAEKFILSRCQLLDLDAAVFDRATIQSMTLVTEGSPLYIEDLMRLTAVVKSAKEAIEKWKTKAGSEARKYALGRECELLGADARHVLLASCVASGPVSFAEVEGVTGLSTERVTAALSELQVLFLIPKPRLIEGEQRFEVNVNTRALVRDTFGSTDLYRRTETAYRTLSKGLPVTGRGAVAAIVRQAVFLVKGSKHVEGEALLLNALQKYESDPDLLGVLGWVYKAWHPPRVIDARERFNRASQLRASRTEMYEHWCQMELREHEWSKAAEAAERGLKILSNNKTLLYYAGYSRGRLGRELLGGLHGTRAQKELDTAKSTLKRALSVSSLDAREKALNADIFRALVLVCELTGDIDGMRHYFRRWTTEYPEDPDASSEWERISRKHRLGSISNAIT
ncbi:MAG TPA: hypothetical protein VJV03_19380, partial [Pyrinomonadaceae bacterium]|nr:hypothetical protein [Pyrinomonadaceae bacterium]